MAESKNRKFAKVATDVDANGNITADGISSDVSLGGGIDSAALTDLIDSDYIALRVGDTVSNAKATGLSLIFGD